MDRGNDHGVWHRKRSKPSGRALWLLISSYIADWIVIIILLIVAFVLGNIHPNRRPFALDNPDISFPYTLKETVPTWLLLVLVAVVPIVAVFIITLVLVPGSTVPKGTPKSLIWRRKLWELHAGWLGLGLSLAIAFFVTNGMKNLFGKPRPDLLARCLPDVDNFEKYIIGGVASVQGGLGQLVSPDICQSTDATTLQDGFRSFPSGHSSSSAAGLIYLSLFIASKLALAVPFLASVSNTQDERAFSAFPSRIGRGSGRRYASHLQNQHNDTHAPSTRLDENSSATVGSDTYLDSGGARDDEHTAKIIAIRSQSAAPPLYLFVIAAAPFATSVFISSSRWFDYRHHGFDILFGYLIGTVAAFFAFRYYHLPIGQGAGWAWAPRSSDKAWWAGVGSYSYAADFDRLDADEEEQVGRDIPLKDNTQNGSPGRKGGNHV